MVLFSIKPTNGGHSIIVNNPVLLEATNCTKRMDVKCCGSAKA